MGNGSLDRSESRPYDPLQRAEILNGIRITGNRKTGIAAGDIEEKSSECEEDPLSVGCRFEGMADFKKSIQQLNYVPALSPNSFREVGEIRSKSIGRVTFDTRIRRILIYE